MVIADLIQGLRLQKVISLIPNSKLTLRSQLKKNMKKKKKKM